MKPATRSLMNCVHLQEGGHGDPYASASQVMASAASGSGPDTKSSIAASAPNSTQGGGSSTAKTSGQNDLHDLCTTSGSSSFAANRHKVVIEGDATEAGPSKWQQVLGDTWWPEFAALTTSLLCIVGLIVMLYHFDRSASPELPYGITLNAITSILATASKSLLLFAVGNSISQQKYSWFQSEKPLKDVQRFDDASRGPLGSLLMLTGPILHSSAALGAVITMISLAFDPFVQQVLRFYPEQVASLSEHANTKQAFSCPGRSVQRWFESCSERWNLDRIS